MSINQLTLPQARAYVKGAHRGLKAVFKDFNMDNDTAIVMANNIWGHLPPKTIIYGFDGNDHDLGHEAFSTEVF